MTASSAPPSATPRPDPDRDVVVLFSRTLRLLGDAGYPDTANRLAAKAWWALKGDDPSGAHRISGVMHYLAKLPSETDELDPRRTPVPEPENTGVN